MPFWLELSKLIDAGSTEFYGPHFINGGKAWAYLVRFFWGQDLIQAMERDRQPKGSMYDGRAALEMIHAVYESARMRAPVDLPLRNRRHPLATFG